MAVAAKIKKKRVTSGLIVQDLWTLWKVQGHIDRAYAGSREDAGMVKIWMDMSFSRILTLLKSFLGHIEAPADWFHQEKQCAGDYVEYVHGGTREDPRKQPGYLIVLSTKLERMVLDRPMEFYFQPPYNNAETWKRVLADYLFVFIDS